MRGKRKGGSLVKKGETIDRKGRLRMMKRDKKVE